MEHVAYCPVTELFRNRGWGPYALRELEAIVLNPMQSRRRGARLPPSTVDVSEELSGRLTAAGFAFSRTPEGYFSVALG
jgi:hypothetical protein